VAARANKIDFQKEVSNDVENKLMELYSDLDVTDLDNVWKRPQKLFWKKF